MQRAFLSRFVTYLSERFPLHQHGILIAAFSFSVLVFSRLSRGLEDFVSWHQYLAAFINALVVFFLLRVADEHKDREDDLRYRPELPVPRGLVTLKELRICATLAAAALFLFDALYFPRIFWLLVPLLIYLTLMTREFFVAEWLRRHQLPYVLSHMLIIPFTDFLCSGFDWLYESAEAPVALGLFFIVSYFNGILLEIGRKLKAPGDERQGVLTYSSMLGMRRATWLWLLVLLCNGLTAAYAAWKVHGTWHLPVILAVTALLMLIPFRAFLQNPDAKKAKNMEVCSGIWTILMYLGLGGVPIIIRMLQ